MVGAIISHRWLKGMTLHVEEHENRQERRSPFRPSLVPLFIIIIIITFSERNASAAFRERSTRWLSPFQM